MARVGLGDGRRLLWVDPPLEADLNPPPAPDDLVKLWSARLIDKLSGAGAASGNGETAAFEPARDTCLAA